MRVSTATPCLQAVSCWDEALRLLDAAPPVLPQSGAMGADDAEMLRGVAQRNLASVAETDGWPYNKPGAEVAAMLERNVLACADAGSEWARGGGSHAAAVAFPDATAAAKSTTTIAGADGQRSEHDSVSSINSPSRVEL